MLEKVVTVKENQQEIKKKKKKRLNLLITFLVIIGMLQLT